MASPRGKPDEWPERVWEAFKYYGESDTAYVASCNRFLASMLEHRLDETIKLVRSLMDLFVRKGEAPNPENYMSGIPSIDLAEMRKANLHDERDVYRHWYSQHIKWPPKCLCERDPCVPCRQIGFVQFGVARERREPFPSRGIQSIVVDLKNCNELFCFFSTFWHRGVLGDAANVINFGVKVIRRRAHWVILALHYLSHPIHGASRYQDEHE